MRGGVSAASDAAGERDIAADAGHQGMSLSLRQDGAEGTVEACAGAAPACSKGGTTLGDGETCAKLPGGFVGTVLPLVRDGAGRGGGAEKLA